jgi:TRAP-type C4-dicarboxylate transport system permease large subunit
MTNRSYFVAGVSIGLLLSVFVLLAWPLFYADRPWPGERASVARPHEYNASPVARSHVFIALLIVGAMIGWFAPRARHIMFAWLGVSAAFLLSFVLRPAAWSSNLAPLAVLLYPAQAALLLLAGLAVHLPARLLR